jgi:hypothetical protein
MPKLLPPEFNNSPRRSPLERQSALDASAFNIEQPKFGADAAVGRKAPQFAVSAEYPMTGDHYRKRISPKRLSHRAGRPRLTESSGYFAVRQRLARRNTARHFVDAAVKWRQPGHIEMNLSEIAGLTVK